MMGKKYGTKSEMTSSVKNGFEQVKMVVVPKLVELGVFEIRI